MSPAHACRQGGRGALDSEPPSLAPHTTACPSRSASAPGVGQAAAEANFQEKKAALLKHCAEKSIPLPIGQPSGSEKYVAVRLQLQEKQPIQTWAAVGAAASSKEKVGQVVPPFRAWQDHPE